MGNIYLFVLTAKATTAHVRKENNKIKIAERAKSTISPTRLKIPSKRLQKAMEAGTYPLTHGVVYRAEARLRPWMTRILPRESRLPAGREGSRKN